jgi:hypothetical protein
MPCVCRHRHVPPGAGVRTVTRDGCCASGPRFGRSFEASKQPSRRALDRAGFRDRRRAWPAGLRKTTTSLVLTLEPNVTG